MALGSSTGISIAVAVVVLAYVVWNQLRRRVLSTRLTLPVILIAIGAASMLNAGPLRAGAAVIIAASLLFDAIGLAAVRAHTMRVWVEGGKAWRQGTWQTAALWVVGAGIHAALDAAARAGSTSDLLYLGVTLAAQRLVLQARARRHQMV
jgi:hypothetical protein